MSHTCLSTPGNDYDDSKLSPSRCSRSVEHSSHDRRHAPASSSWAEDDPEVHNNNSAHRRDVSNETAWTREYDAELQVQELERRSRYRHQRFQSMFLWLDLIVFTVAWTVYAALLLLYHHKQQQHDSREDGTAVSTLTVGMLLVASSMAALLFLRSTLGLLALFQSWASCGWGRAVLPVSALFTLVYLVLTVGSLLVAWIEPHWMSKFLRRGEQPWLIPAALAPLAERHANQLWVVWFVLLVEEAARWQLARHYYHNYMLVQQSSRPPVRSVSYNNNNNNNNSSWWSVSAVDDDDAFGHEPLLLEHRNQQRLQQQQHASLSWFRSFFRRRGGGAQDSDDDSSGVLFASVQEEWATRSQEDGPLWWSRQQEEENGQIQNNKRIRSPRQPSWAKTRENDNQMGR